MGWLGEILKSVPDEKKAELKRAAGRERPNSTPAGAVDPGRAGAAKRRIANRNMDELIGMCRMVLADGAVDDSEAKFLLHWVESNFQAIQQWPGNVLYERIFKAMADGSIDPAEESELLDVLHKISGGEPTADAPRVSGAVPYDDPAPGVVFQSRSFVCTGQFVFGTRKIVSAAIEERGGVVRPNCSGKTHYLVIGTFGSDEWLHSTHGTKILKAVELKQAGKELAIISERLWTEHLN